MKAHCISGFLFKKLIWNTVRRKITSELKAVPSTWEDFVLDLCRDVMSIDDTFYENARSLAVYLMLGHVLKWKRVN